jgi:hypothetical protein
MEIIYKSNIGPNEEVCIGSWTNFSLRALGRVFNFRSGCMHTMHLLPSVAIQPNLELKTRPKTTSTFSPVSYRAPRLDTQSA